MDENLQYTNQEDSKHCLSKKLFAVVLSIMFIVFFALVFFRNTTTIQEVFITSHNNLSDLPGCETYSSFVCKGSSGNMDEKWKDQLWNTPPRGEAKWVEGYQDMNALVGYARQIYSNGMKSCKVIVYTRTSTDMKLKYFFNGVAQSSNIKLFDYSYEGVLKIRVVSDSGEELVLDDIDFVWNVTPLKPRRGDYRNGQKGAIVELFGWPDDDIALECKHIAEAGYLGVKIYPHQEQVMSEEPENGEMNPWYYMYQPVSYRLQGRMGSRDQLRNMINKCRSYGLRVYGDAVVNHMTGNGNDASNHRSNDNGKCTYWGYKNTSSKDQSPFYTPKNTYEQNPYSKRGTNVLEYPAVPYGPMDFHCDKGINRWDDPNLLNTGWLVGLADLDTSKDYVRQRIADFFVDMLSIGFSGFRIDAAKHIHPDDLASIFGKLKQSMGGSLPVDFISWLEVIIGGEAWLIVKDSDYSFTTHFTQKLKDQGLTDNEIETIKIWWSAYPVDPNIDENRLPITRKAIQNDDHDQQAPGSTSRDLGNQGCVLIKGCPREEHKKWEKKLFTNPNYAWNNDNDYPIRMLLSSYYFSGSYENPIASIPDGKSDCKTCKRKCEYCRTRRYANAYKEFATAYDGNEYTRVHRDPEIISAMRKWVHLE